MLLYLIIIELVFNSVLEHFNEGYTILKSLFECGLSYRSGYLPVYQ